MKRHQLFLLVSALLLSPAVAAEDVTSAITEVTVYADRAQVTRQASIALGADAGLYAFTELPGWIDEGSLRVALEPAAAGEILDVEVRRAYLARASDEEVLRAAADVAEASDEMKILDDETTVLEAQMRTLEEIRLFSLEKAPRDVALRPVEPAEYTAAVDFLGSTLRRILEDQREVGRKRRELEPELVARQRRLGELRQRAQLEQRTVVVAVAGRAARTATLRLTYMLPGATWLPVHEVRAARGDGGVTLTSYAAARQTSGEDWAGIKVALATQRSTETLRIPEVEALLLGGGRSVARLAADPGESFDEANKSWAAQNAAYFKARSADKNLESYHSNQRVQLDNARRVSEVFRTLAQRGTTAHFVASGEQTVRSDGRRVRLPIGSVRLAAEHRTLAAPELSLNAVRTVELTNTGGQPFLPGKVSLYVDGAFLGLTELGFVAPGESFSLFLGVADQLKISRTLDKKRSELSRRGARTRMGVSFLLRAENLSGARERVQLRDRVPVSQVESIKVLGVKVTPSGAPDARGLLSWDLDLGAREAREFRVEYTVEYPTGLLARQETYEMEYNEAIGTTEEMAREANELERQLRALEKQF